MNYYCQIKRDPNSQQILLQIVDENGAVIAGKGAIRISMADLRATLLDGQVPLIALAPLDGVTDANGAAVQDANGDPTAFIFAPAGFAPPLKAGGGGSASFAFYDNNHSYKAGAFIQITSSYVVGGITVLPGTYGCMADVPAHGTANQIPQFPYPSSGTVYWMLIALGINAVNVCAGGSKQVYINSSSTF